MKNGQQGFSNALGNIATQSIEAVGQPARLTQADHRNGADAQESSEVGNGSPLPAATIRRNESRIKTVVAVDPGASGGLAFESDDQAVEAVPIPSTEGDLAALLRRLTRQPDQAVAFVEEVSGYAGTAQPGSRMFTFGRNFGFILGVLQTLGVRIELVKPSKWQKALSLGTASACASKTIWKNKLKACAQRLYPNLHVTLQTADALLILEYGRKTRGS